MGKGYIKSISNTEVKYNGTFTITQNIRGRLNLKGKGPFYIINKLLDNMHIPISIDDILLNFNEKNRTAIIKIIHLLIKKNIILFCDSDIEKNFNIPLHIKKKYSKELEFLNNYYVFPNIHLHRVLESKVELYVKDSITNIYINNFLSLNNIGVKVKVFQSNSDFNYLIITKLNEEKKLLYFSLDYYYLIFSNEQEKLNKVTSTTKFSEENILEKEFWITYLFHKIFEDIYIENLLLEEKFYFHKGLLQKKNINLFSN